MSATVSAAQWLVSQGTVPPFSQPDVVPRMDAGSAGDFGFWPESQASRSTSHRRIDRLYHPERGRSGSTASRQLDPQTTWKLLSDISVIA